MHDDDGFKTRFNAVVMALRAWSDKLADVAEIERNESVVAWRLALQPRTVGGCPFELVLRSEGPNDIAIDSEVFADCGIDDVERFPPLLQAIVDGRVEVHKSVTAATGMAHSAETIVSPVNAAEWRRVRYNPNLLSRGSIDLVRSTRHYLRYRR